MSTEHPNSRRPYGTGHLYVKTTRAGQRTYYGRWRTGGKLRNRSIGSCDLLTRKQAERRLQDLISKDAPTGPAPKQAGLTVAQAGAQYLEHTRLRGRKPSTLGNLESELRVHIAPHFAGRAIASVTARDVDSFARQLAAGGLAPKSVRNVIGTLSAIFAFVRNPLRGWVAANPCDGLELPTVPDADQIRFLGLDELELLVANARPGIFQELDRALYRTAAMTGLRRGELLALRWADVDWLAQRIRVRRNYVRGEFGTPKTRRSTRSVPMADTVAGALEGLSRTSSRTSDSDLVFGHPVTGEPLYPAGLLRRMRKALQAARLDDSHRFHDLRHTFGTQCAAAGVPIRTIQEWMGHRDITTTQRYADYAPSSREADMVTAAFGRADGTIDGTISAQLTASQST